MVINISIQDNGGFLLDIMLLTQVTTIGNSFKYHGGALPLQPR